MPGRDAIRAQANVAAVSARRRRKCSGHAVQLRVGHDEETVVAVDAQLLENDVGSTCQQVGHGAASERCRATPTITRAIPARSTNEGNWLRTTTPITVAVAGRSATNSAYVARGKRAIASWSNTYGMTDDETPTPIPAAIAIGSPSACAAPENPIGETKTKAKSIAAASPSTPPIAVRRETRWAGTMEAGKGAALANAKAIPTGSPANSTRVRRYTPAAAAVTAVTLRPTRAPISASAIGPMNSIAATVASGSRSIET